MDNSSVIENFSSESAMIDTSESDHIGVNGELSQTIITSGSYGRVQSGSYSAELEYVENIEEAQKIIDEDPECKADKFSMLWNRLRQLRKTNINWSAIS